MFRYRQQVDKKQQLKLYSSTVLGLVLWEREKVKSKKKLKRGKIMPWKEPTPLPQKRHVYRGKSRRQALKKYHYMMTKRRTEHENLNVKRTRCGICTSEWMERRHLAKKSPPFPKSSILKKIRSTSGFGTPRKKLTKIRPWLDKCKNRRAPKDHRAKWSELKGEMVWANEWLLNKSRQHWRFIRWLPSGKLNLKVLLSRLDYPSNS